MQQESALLIGVLRQAVTEKKELLVAENVDWNTFCVLTSAHNVCALVWHGLQDHQEVIEQMPEDLQKRMSGKYLHAIYRDSQLEYIKDSLESALSQEKVPHIFLKGARLKYDYPVPALRTMCDMDVLVKTEDYERITKVSENLGGSRYYGDGNHRNYQFPGGVAVEFHPNLIHPGTPVATQINPGWQYAQEDVDGYCKSMTAEGIYLNTICHLAEHFIAGGVGVRFVLDVWICNHRSKPYDREFVQKELKRFHLLDFAEKIEALAEVWFSGKETTPLLEELGEYILTSGSHGRKDRAMLNAVSLSPGGNRFSALWHKVFYPREELEIRYPWSRGKPWLLPAAWCARAFGAVTQRGHLIRKWSSGTGEVTREAAEQQRRKLASFGITRNKDRK